MSPIYEYRCATCNTQIERFTSVENRDGQMQCEKCGSPMQRITFPQDDIKKREVSNVFRKV